MKLNIKPLSVNTVWQGQRFKTDAYLSYEKEVILSLKQLTVPEGCIGLNLTFGFSTSNSDIDNCCKPFIDILQKKYNFNDRNIYELNVKKQLVKKGNEFINFEFYKIYTTEDYKHLTHSC